MRLIDADTLKEEVNKKNVVGRFNTLLLIDNAPTVLERPHGEWVIEKNTTFEFYMKCSNCDHPAEWLDCESQLLSNFCPNCGADMRGKNHDNG